MNKKLRKQVAVGIIQKWGKKYGLGSKQQSRAGYM